jgi:hypothetical protein
MRIATWNVLSLYTSGVYGSLCDVMKNNKEYNAEGGALESKERVTQVGNQHLTCSWVKTQEEMERELKGM